uniref:Uncharacterized protein n=1 Tax=Rhizophora mucronata TaxID=61149 RepID=A0A2P2JBR6_RHIMU
MLSTFASILLYSITIFSISTTSKTTRSTLIHVCQDNGSLTSLEFAGTRNTTSFVNCIN